MAAYSVTTAEGLAYTRPAARPSARAVSDGIRTAGIAQTALAWCLIALMALCSVAVWTVVPVGGLWLGSQLTDSVGQLSAGACACAAIAILAAMAVTGKALAKIERLYLRVTETAPSARIQPAWRRSVSENRGASTLSVLDRIMVVSVLIAATTMAGWFLLFAGPSV
jgi:hypothetical protein